MNKIIHCKIPMLQNSPYGDGLYGMALTPAIRRLFDKQIQEKLNEAFPDDHYIVISSPNDVTAISGDTPIISIECKEYTANELIEAIRKAELYDAEIKKGK